MYSSSLTSPRDRVQMAFIELKVSSSTTVFGSTPFTGWPALSSTGSCRSTFMRMGCATKSECFLTISRSTKASV